MKLDPVTFSVPALPLTMLTAIVGAAANAGWAPMNRAPRPAMAAMDVTTRSLMWTSQRTASTVGTAEGAAAGAAPHSGIQSTRAAAIGRSATGWTPADPVLTLHRYRVKRPLSARP